jgi:o-succinylbenzoate synthase
MKLYFVKYELKGYDLADTRKGALLKVDFGGDAVGYADCHPWVELGDKPLDNQLYLLSAGILTNLTERSLKFAQIDAEARVKGRSLFSNLCIPSSHWFLKNLDETIPDGFCYSKVKLGKFPKEELFKLPSFFSSLPNSISLRLDFNCRIDAELFRSYLHVIQPYLHKIDFIEDPFPFNSRIWAKIQSEFPLKLALDLHSERYLDCKNTHQVTIIKPAAQDDERILQKACHNVVYTSYLDHPLGQAAAAYKAALAARDHPAKVLTCGLLSQYIYQTNKYSELLGRKGDCLSPPSEGSGFGFDALLAREKWRDLG